MYSTGASLYLSFVILCIIVFYGYLGFKYGKAFIYEERIDKNDIFSKEILEKLAPHSWDCFYCRCFGIFILLIFLTLVWPIPTIIIIVTGILYFLRHKVRNETKINQTHNEKED